jgi:hypothetical protein
VDVGFLDPGTAKTMSRTKFTFKVTRAHDYAAGEYKVTVIDARTGKKVGQPQTLKFLGENKVIDRRSVVFSGKKKKKKKPEEESSEKSDSGDGSGSDDDAAIEDAEMVDLDDEGDEPPSVDEKPGGCGCRLPGGASRHSPGAPAGILIIAGLAVAAGRRRRAA